uniref:Apple domain-containing protein n=1 Tax=Romanomermis culicivorax TaxID=13658 RepID=A0A915IRB9_ROMCU
MCGNLGTWDIYITADLTCPPGKILNPCGDFCQETCKDVTTNNLPKVCPRLCRQAACVCPDGQALIRGQCVAYDQCWRLPPEDQEKWWGLDGRTDAKQKKDECTSFIYPTQIILQTHKEDRRPFELLKEDLLIILRHIEQVKAFVCTHVTYNGKNKVCFLQHADTKKQILDTRYDSNNNAWCAYYNGEDRFVAAAALTTTKPVKTTTESTVSKPKFTIEKDCEYQNYDMSDVKNIPSHAMCANQCQINKRCTHATYYFNNQVCFLQHASSKAVIQETRSQAINSWCILYNDGDRFEPAVGLAITEPESLKK